VNAKKGYFKESLGKEGYGKMERMGMEKKFRFDQ